jgi:acyl-CoA thioesterase FadM
MEQKDLKEFKVDLSYQDVDITGSIYHCKYFDFAEKARTNIIKGLINK